MKKILTIFIIFINLFSFLQEKNIIYYNYGYNGMELFSKSEKKTIIYSNFNARPEIRKEVGTYIIKNYKNLKSGIVVIKIDNVIVEGKFEIVNKGKLIFLNYYYYKVIYKDSITMIYKKPVKKK